VAFGELTLLGPANRIVQALTFLRDHPDYRFHQLVDLTASTIRSASAGSTSSITCCRW
jgi:hypothetical protein